MREWIVQVQLCLGGIKLPMILLCDKCGYGSYDKDEFVVLDRPNKCWCHDCFTKIEAQELLDIIFNDHNKYKMTCPGSSVPFL